MFKPKKLLLLSLSLSLSLSFLLLSLPAFLFAEESITITTYYPSPYGVYNQLQTNTLGVGDNNGDGALDSGDVPNPLTNSGDVWIKGQVKIAGGSPAAGRILTSDASGLASWEAQNSITTQAVVTASRAFNTVYRNTTGKPMFITVGLNGYAGRGAWLKTDSTSPPATIVACANVNQGCDPASFIVLPGNYYMVHQDKANMICYWTEWY